MEEGEMVTESLLNEALGHHCDEDEGLAWLDTLSVDDGEQLEEEMQQALISALRETSKKLEAAACSVQNLVQRLNEGLELWERLSKVPDRDPPLVLDE